MEYYLIAGETSGDLHGANLIHALKQIDTQAKFRFVGGDAMQNEASKQAVLHTSAMSFMGFVEVFINLFKILKNLRTVKADLITNRPDCVLLIDFPGFNLKIAAYAKKNGIPVYYYISPKVWAWNQKRVLMIKKVVDKMFCILPFEVDFYKHWGMEVDYVGNPLLDAIANYQPDPNFRYKNHIDHKKPIVALLPGSRKMEISKLLPIMSTITSIFPTHQFIVAGAPNLTEDYYQHYISGENLPIIFNATYDLLNHADAAIVASGTATLETALFRVPQVVVYKANALSVWIARQLVKIKFISLVNLILDVPVVRELIQNDFNKHSLSDELDRLLNDENYRRNMLQNYDGLLNIIGNAGASERTAKLIYSYLKDSNKTR